MCTNCLAFDGGRAQLMALGGPVGVEWAGWLVWVERGRYSKCTHISNGDLTPPGF